MRLGELARVLQREMTCEVVDIVSKNIVYQGPSGKIPRYVSAARLADFVVGGVGVRSIDDRFVVNVYSYEVVKDEKGEMKE